MNKFLIAVGMATVVFGGNYAMADSAPKHVTLENKNTVSLREEFDSSSINDLNNRIIGLSQTLPEKEHIFLYLDTPGGSVISGAELNEVIHGVKNKVDVIVNFAASMGYLTTQAVTGSRYITNTGILMAHRAYGGSEGQIPGNQQVRTTFFAGFISNLSAQAAKRTGLSLVDYETKVRDEFWVSGQEAVKENQADEVVTVSCAADLSGTYTETLQTMFGPVGIVWASCPLVTAPLALDFSGIKTEYQNEVKVNDMEQTITQAMMHKRELLNSPALEEAFLSYVK
jgi:ATP-dependent protease ClpP protease subunit